MADIFMKFDACNLLKEKFVLLLGDSNMSIIYNDLLYLLLNNCVTTPLLLRGRDKKRWNTYLGDKVLRLSSFDTAGRDYFKEREYKMDNLHIRYHFITKVSGHEMNYTLSRIEKKEIPYPDILIVNSCMWDITRWGPLREDEYKTDLLRFFARLKKVLPEDSLVIWTSTLPISTNFVKGGVLLQQLEFMKFSLRFMILEANKFTQQLCMAFGIDFLDLHYHMRFQLHRRSVDGIHWEPQAARHIICILLTHICLAYELPLPGKVRNNNKYLQTCIENAEEETLDIDIETLPLERNIITMIEDELKKIARCEKQVFKMPIKTVDFCAHKIDHPSERVKKIGRRMSPISKKNENKRGSSIFDSDLRVILNNSTCATKKSQDTNQRAVSVIQKEELKRQKSAHATRITKADSKSKFKCSAQRFTKSSTHRGTCSFQQPSSVLNATQMSNSAYFGGQPNFPFNNNFQSETHLPLAFNFASTSSGVPPWQNRKCDSASSSGMYSKMNENLESFRTTSLINQNFRSMSSNFRFPADFRNFDPIYQFRF